MNFIVFDLEATCWEDDTQLKRHTQEIIEIGAVLILENGEEDGSYQSFVRPKHHPNLSNFCMNLTSITQIDVNRAGFFPDVIEDFKEWFDFYDEEEEYRLCSWGAFDKKALERDCRLHGLDPDWCEHHINLKQQYASFKGLRKEIGLKSAVEREGFEFEGTHHRAISDAENLAKIFVKYLNLWEI